MNLSPAQFFPVILRRAQYRGTTGKITPRQKKRQTQEKKHCEKKRNQDAKGRRVSECSKNPDDQRNSDERYPTHLEKWR